MSPQTKKYLIIGAAALAAVYAVSYWLAPPASAADLGGSCCADLEERIAELEATVATKGNRKVRLEISGNVNKAVLAYKAGDEKDVHVIENGAYESRLDLRAEAHLRPGWWAGAILSFDLGESGASLDGELITDNDITDRLAYVYLKNETFGTVAIGLQSTATDDLTQDSVARTIYSSKRLTAQPLLGEASEIFNGYKANGARYTSPTIAGFSFSAAWDSDTDAWDAALRYDGEYGGFALIAGIGYLDYNEDGLFDTFDARTLTLNLGVRHVASGIFVQGSYGRLDADAELSLATADGDFDAWHVQAGIERKLFENHGPTTIFGEYADWGGSIAISDDDEFTYVEGSFKFYGIGINQNLGGEFDLYALARRYEVGEGAEDIDTFMAGLRVGF
jgi:hypothetical protein